MLKEGALGGIEAIFKMHDDNRRLTGTIVIILGPILAAVRFSEAKIEGKVGHAADPHKSTDPILVVSFTLLALQQLILSEVDPLHSHVWLLVFTFTPYFSASMLLYHIKLL